MGYRFFIFLIFCSLNWANASTTENDSKRKNIKLVDAYVDDRGVTLFKVKYQDSDGPTPNPTFIMDHNFMCFKTKCYQMEGSGMIQMSNQGGFLNMVEKFDLDETKKKGVWKVEEGSVPSLECPKFTKTLKKLSKDELASLTENIHSGKVVLVSLPEEASYPQFYYEDGDKNIIYVDRTKYKIPRSYHYFEGKSGNLKEVKVTKHFESIPGNPELTLEDGRKEYVGRHTTTIKRDKQVYVAKDIYSVDFDSLKVPSAERYKYTLTTPCSEFSSEEDCVSGHECKGAKLINDSSRSTKKELNEDSSTIKPSIEVNPQ